jgi:hypothetical protein
VEVGVEQGFVALDVHAVFFIETGARASVG